MSTFKLPKVAPLFFVALFFAVLTQFQLASAEPKVFVDSQAIALLDRVATHYQNARTLELELEEIEFGSNRPTGKRVFISFQRSGNLQLREESAGCNSTRVVTRQLRSSLREFAPPVGDLMAQWLWGAHLLRPASKQRFASKQDRFTASYFAPESRPFDNAILGDRVVEGVRWSAWAVAQGKERDIFFQEQMLWFAPDSSELVRVQSRSIGSNTRREVSYNVVSQRIQNEASLPPRGSKAFNPTLQPATR